MFTDIKTHYDLLIDEGNDPCFDPEPLKNYMDKWDGERFINELNLSEDKNVLEIGVGTGRLAMRVCGRCKSFWVKRAQTEFAEIFIADKS